MERIAAMAINLKRLLHDYHERRAAEASKPLPTARLGFDQPLTVKTATYHLPGYGLLFCVHGRSYFETCHQTTCRRNKKEADQRLRSFLSTLNQTKP